MNASCSSCTTLDDGDQATAHRETVENTPPDFLLLGRAASQDFKADSFALGLCWLHLLTGRAPYEEILENLTCPSELRHALDDVWRQPGDGPYAPVRELLESYGDDDEAAIIHTTLYRFLCLFGLPDDVGAAAGAADTDADGAAAAVAAQKGAVVSSDAWKAVRAWLDTAAGKSKFGKDRAQWSITSGRAKPIAEAQKRMAKLCGAEQMLRGLTRFEPSCRWSARRALRSELFAPYLCSSASDGGAWAPSNTTLRFTDYLNDSEQED